MKNKRNAGTYIYPASALLEQFPDDAWASTIADHLGIERSAVQRWRGGNVCLDLWRADRYACAIGKHPSEIWPEWFDQSEQVAS